jgi:3-phenylpropionate/cinnamic acid dioxygenase small subunit
MDTERRERVSAFYAYEYALLDDNELGAWMELLDDDVRYFMSLAETVLGSEQENTGLPPFYLYNEDKGSIVARVARLQSGLTLVESPPSSVHRTVSNVVILEDDGALVQARTNVSLFEARDEQNEYQFFARRVDRLRWTADGFRIKHRSIRLAQFVLPHTISHFF